MRWIHALAAVVVLLTATAAGYVYTGAYDVAATRPHPPVAAWALHRAMTQSVQRHARGVALSQLAGRTERGFLAYRDMCAGCHGAPGVEPLAVGQGLRPRPADLSKTAERWSPAELFWIVKHGIRMTGMPAWGATHSDEELWDVVAFVRRLPGMSPAEYQRMDRERPGVSHEHAQTPDAAQDGREVVGGHRHGPGEAH